MERKTITIREDQSKWIEEHEINLSQLVQQAIDDHKSPTDEELAAAYAENASRAAEVNGEWSNASIEANEHLGERTTEK